MRYAAGQLKKAYGLNKKFLNPMPEQRKSVLDFCYVTEEKGSLDARTWLSRRSMNQEKCGLAGVDHFPNTYLLYHSTESILRGIVADEQASEVRLSNVPKELEPLAYIHFNKDAFKAHCEKHKSYWEWVKNRNQDRYATNKEHGKQYDSKNMMHVFRLLNTAEDIATHGTINLRGYDRNHLLRIKSGEFEYDDLVRDAEQKINHLESLFKKSSLPDQPDIHQVESLMVELRSDFYQLSG